MGATEEAAANLNAVANDPALAVLANRGNGLNRALEAVESVTSAGGYQFETLVVFVATNFTSSHASSSHYGALNIQPSVSSSARCLGRAVWSLSWHKRCYATSDCPLALGRKEQGPTMLARNFTVRQLQLAMAGPVSGDNILAITIRAFDKGDAQICACRRLVQDSTST
jgi:hypothetical protein